MEITIADVKSLCRISEKENVPEGFVGIGSDYTFSSFNSKTLFPNNQIVIVKPLIDDNIKNPLY